LAHFREFCRGTLFKARLFQAYDSRTGLAPRAREFFLFFVQIATTTKYPLRIGSPMSRRQREGLQLENTGWQSRSTPTMWKTFAVKLPK
jgi:hypothetical protein